MKIEKGKESKYRQNIQLNFHRRSIKENIPNITLTFQNVAKNWLIISIVMSHGLCQLKTTTAIYILTLVNSTFESLDFAFCGIANVLN